MSPWAHREPFHMVECKVKVKLTSMWEFHLFLRVLSHIVRVTATINRHLEHVPCHIVYLCSKCESHASYFLDLNANYAWMKPSWDTWNTCCQGSSCMAKGKMGVKIHLRRLSRKISTKVTSNWHLQHAPQELSCVTECKLTNMRNLGQSHKS